MSAHRASFGDSIPFLNSVVRSRLAVDVSERTCARISQLHLADLAQLAEHLICNQRVSGSNPLIGIKRGETMTYKNIILDDSILDIDSWLPQEAIDELVEFIKNYDNTSENKENKGSKHMFEFQIRGENITITDAINDYTKSKLSKLEKYFSDDDVLTVRVNAKVYPNKKAKAEVTIPYKNFTLRAEETSDDWYSSLDLVVDKLEGQIRKHKTKLQNRNKIRVEPIIDELEPIEEFARTKSVDIQAMSTQDAAIQMDLLEHDFFVFLNKETAHINIVYRRKDGTNGLLKINHRCPYEPVGKEVW